MAANREKKIHDIDLGLYVIFPWLSSKDRAGGRVGRFLGLFFRSFFILDSLFSPLYTLFFMVFPLIDPGNPSILGDL